MQDARHADMETLVASHARKPQGRDDEIVAVRIARHEADLRERAERLGPAWRLAQKVWEMHWSDARRLGLTERVVAP